MPVLPEIVEKSRPDLVYATHEAAFSEKPPVSAGEMDRAF
jgi:hypothetical protein